MKYLLELPPTAEALALEPDWSEIDAELQIVYKKAPGSDNYVFAGEYFPDNDGISPEEDAIIVPVSSVYVGTTTWNANDEFSNLLGSSDDKPHDIGNVTSTWHKLADKANIPWLCHAERNKFYDCFSGSQVTNSGGKTYACDTSYVGGHVHKGRMPGTENDYSTIYVLPICHNHNSMCVNHGGTTPGNGNGFFMRLDHNTPVLKMTGYWPHKCIQEHLHKAQVIK